MLPNTYSWFSFWHISVFSMLQFSLCFIYTVKLHSFKAEKKRNTTYKSFFFFFFPEITCPLVPRKQIRSYFIRSYFKKIRAEISCNVILLLHDYTWRILFKVSFFIRHMDFYLPILLTWTNIFSMERLQPILEKMVEYMILGHFKSW